MHQCLFGNFLLGVAVPFGKTLHCLRPFLPASCELQGVKLPLVDHPLSPRAVSLQTWRAKGVSQHVCVRSPFWQRRQYNQRPSHDAMQSWLSKHKMQLDENHQFICFQDSSSKWTFILDPRLLIIALFKISNQPTEVLPSFHELHL